MSDLSSQVVDALRQENVEKILDTAERLFKHYGYSKTNVADIARDLSMSPANIYRFFSSKAEIHQALARRMLSVQYEALKANAAGPGSVEERLKSHLILMHRITVETMLEEERVHEMVLVALDQQWPVIEEHLTRIRHLLAGLIREGIDAGEFRTQDPMVAAECFICFGVTLCHPQLVAKKGRGEDEVEPLVLAEYMIRALK
ncbi:TetR/AcrR family transcriptional regulator [Rhizobium straminoryzae]|uniref:TetR/AcrR family transcriptional regulator n=1 Tax=Rhizobium straminoryzae TaxID=1387186 RepID=A0A549TA67_9HYPH|nr:TetR/AcrR family transcriptional regulator [Rhizobium straminoryzae]TRL38764.1 TetR/AcrR family transcriptional regulator [Rhizobium straminoryzae]